MTMQTSLSKKYPVNRWAMRIGISNLGDFAAQAAISTVVSITVTTALRQMAQNG